MGRIKGPSSVFRERLVEKQPSYKQDEPNYLREGLKDIGAVLQVGTQIYQNPMLKDAAAGLFDLFSSDKKAVAETVAKGSEAQALKDAAMARRADAMRDMEEARPTMGPPQGPVQMPTGPTDAETAEIESLKAQAQQAAQVAQTADTQLVDREQAIAERMAIIDKETARIEAAVAQAGPQAERAYDVYNKQRQQFEQLRGLAELETDPEAKQEYIDQANSAKTQMNQAFAAFEQVRGIKDTLDALDKADTAAQLAQKNVEALRGEVKTKSLARAQDLNRLATEKAAALANRTEEQINIAVDRILEVGPPPEAQERYNYIKSRLQVDEETGDVFLNVPTEERVAMSNNPGDATLLAAATKQLERDMQQQEGMFATGGDLGSALAGLEEAGVDISPEPTETAPEGTAPAQPGVTPTPTTPRLIQDTPLVDLPPEETNRLIREVQDRVLTDFDVAAPQINAVVDQLRAQYGDAALGRTSAEVEKNIRGLAEMYSGMAPTPEGGIQVPDIAGMSIQEAENVAMEIAASNASMSAKTAAMRKLIGQAGELDDIVPAWMARGGTLGYLDRDMAADRLRKAFTGMVPKPKAARPMSVTEALKLRRAPEQEKQDVLKTETMREKLAKMKAMTPIEIRNALLKNVPALAKLKTWKKGKSASGAGIKDLEEFREELLSSSDASRKFMDAASERLDQKVATMNDITVQDLEGLKPNQIARQYGPDLGKYLQDVRNAKTEAAKTAALNKAKAKVRADFAARAKKLKAAAKRLATITGKLREERIQKDRKKKEKLLRELNNLLVQIQQGE